MVKRRTVSPASPSADSHPHRPLYDVTLDSDTDENNVDDDAFAVGQRESLRQRRGGGPQHASVTTSFDPYARSSESIDVRRSSNEKATKPSSLTNRRFDYHDGRHRHHHYSSSSMPPQQHPLGGDGGGAPSRPAMNGSIEIEEEAPRRQTTVAGGAADDVEDLLGLGLEPVRTESGLQLTHRRVPVAPVAARRPQQQQQQARGHESAHPNLLARGGNHAPPPPSPFDDGDGGGEDRPSSSSSYLRFASRRGEQQLREANRGGLGPSIEMNSYGRSPPSQQQQGGGGRGQTPSSPWGGSIGIGGSGSGGAGAGSSSYSFVAAGPDRQRALLRCVRLWTGALFAVVLLGTGVAVAAVRHERRAAAAATTETAAAAAAMSAAGVGAEIEAGGGARTSPTTITADATKVEAAAAQAKADGGSTSSSQQQQSLNGVAKPPPLLPEGAVKLEYNSSEQRRRKLSQYPEEVVRKLRTEFDDWADGHGRKYGSHGEKERRFGVWLDNHHRTLEKNEKHGPCKLTGKKVFGENHFKDLTSEEFKSRYLTGYHGPRAEEHLDLPKERLLRADEAAKKYNGRGGGSPSKKEERVGGRSSPPVGASTGTQVQGDPRTSVERHPSVQKRYLQHWDEKTPFFSSLQQQMYVESDAATSDCNINKEGGGGSSTRCSSNWYSSITFMGCKWYDCSCLLRRIFSTRLYRHGTSEPAYDADSFPSAFDWRDMGVVTEVHSQGNCGACWAITAVETVESAYAISKGTLYDLAESEIIMCDDTCQMCDGGWPQNAYDYVMAHNGIPAEGDWSYDGDWLLTLTMVTSGESDQYSYSEITEYLYQQCPNYGQGGSGSGDNNYSGETSSFPRYGQIKGYGYSTDKCLCYTDGTGCYCEEQNEKLALMNVASYGPATVCLDASTWQDYAGGILTADSGCSSGFLDMNHCVQAVGYAFTDGTDGEEEEEGEQGSGSQNSGSSDDVQRTGYWIIRNQWSSNWGMSGYLYVAMGQNTCGVLNDMTQVFA